MTNTVHWILELHINEGHLRGFKELMAEMIAATAKESGTLVYEWYFSQDESTCLISERYRDSAAAMEHLQSFGRFAERFLAAATPTRFTVLGAPDSTLRQALAGFSPACLAFEAGFARANA